MTASKAKLIRRIRIACQLGFLVLFFFLLVKTGMAKTVSFGLSDLFFLFDPLLFLITFLATGVVLKTFLLSLIPLALTAVFGRFFCGWICPLGTLNQFFSWVAARGKKKKKSEVPKKALKIKYVVLVLILAAALMGTQAGGWLDPFSLLTRSSAVAVAPALNYTVEHSLQAGAGDKGIAAKILKPAYNMSRRHLLYGEQRVFTQSVFVGLLFLLILGLNFYRRRFFCNTICPLGALYGLVARFSFLNLKTKPQCRGCNLCARSCTYEGSPFQDYSKADCLLCFNCLSDCPHDSIAVSFFLPRKENRTSLDLGRRRMLGAAVTGIAAGALPNISLKERKKAHGFLRPPGSRNEKEFLARCVRCGECMQVCPTNVIQPALFESGLEGIWTPVLNPTAGYCEYECNRCTRVCPTEAIQKISLEEKKEFKIGTAVIDRTRCYTYADGYDCAVCEEHCPVPDKAIRLREVEVWNFEGKKVKVNQIYVVPELCIGCGICENVCPRSDQPAIRVSSEEEQREFSYY